MTQSFTFPGMRSIGAKISLLVVIGLGIGCAAMMALQSGMQRQLMERDALHNGTAIAELLAANVSGGVRWNKVSAIEQAYASFVAREDSQLANLAIHSVNGKILAEYRAASLPRTSLAGLPGKHAAALERGEIASEIVDEHVLVAAPINAGGKRVGSLALAFSLAHNNELMFEHMLHQTGIAVLLVAIQAALLILLLRAVVLSPLQRLITLMRDIAEGDADLRRRLNFHQRDELGVLAGLVDQFIERLQGTVSRLIDATGEVSDSAGGASQAAQTTRNELHLQEREITAVATAMSEMSASVAEVARSAAETAGATGEADSETRRGREVVGEAMASIQSLASDVERAAEVIRRVEQESESIGQVLGVIRDITEQTNLLALNAAIEAARAGEQGRGFAVVADEVRTLACRTQESTREIETTIEQLQAQTRSAVQVMDQGRSQAQQSVHSAQAAGEVLDGITRSMSGMADLNNQIASAAEQQRCVAAEVTRNVESINVRSREVAARSDTAAQTCDDLSRLAGELKSLVAQFEA